MNLNDEIEINLLSAVVFNVKIKNKIKYRVDLVVVCLSSMYIR